MDSILQQMYSDFTGKILPMVWEWIMITKDYALDLGGRYIDFYIYSSIFFLIIFGILSIVIWYMSHRRWGMWVDIDSDHDRHRYRDSSWYYAISVFGSFLCILFAILSISNVYDIIKAATVPEIIIAEKIMDIKNWYSCQSCD